MMRLPLSVVSPAGDRGRLSILIFHRVLAAPDPLFPETPSAADFEERLQWIKSWFNVMPLGDAIKRLYSGSLPARALAITFDDGYADNVELAAPILRRLGLSATFFISTGFLHGECMWNDQVIEAIRQDPSDEIDLRTIGLPKFALNSATERKRTIETLLTTIKHREPGERQSTVNAIVAAAGGRHAPSLMMRPDQVRTLKALGMDVGAHTVTHPILTRVDGAVARDEMMRSKLELEKILGEAVPLFAYPNGVPGKDYAIEHTAMARDCGFEAAVSTAWGAASKRTDRFQLPRFTPWDRTRLRYGARLLRNLVQQRSLTV